MISVVCFKWKSPGAGIRQFNADNVNILYAMVKRNLKLDFKFFCVTDDKKEINEDIITVDLWKEPKMPAVKTERPQCYKRLKLFSPESKEIFGPRVVSLDLDTVIIKDVTSIFSTPGDFVGYNKKYIPYQGAFFIHEIGTRPYIWEEFDPIKSPKLAKKYEGSDQAWLSYRLPKNERVVTKANGIYCYDVDRLHKRLEPPKDCRMVIFRGAFKPHYPHVFNKHPWIQSHYRV